MIRTRPASAGASSGAPGGLLTLLRAIPIRHLKTWLRKAVVGAISVVPAHDQIEQTVGLEGSFYDQHKIFDAGSMIKCAPMRRTRRAVNSVR